MGKEEIFICMCRQWTVHRHTMTLYQSSEGTEGKEAWCWT